MIVFRQTDARYPFLWETSLQPAGRWHTRGDGPAHYFADTPDGAWAEFLRHEDITDREDLETIRRQLWAIEIGDAPLEPVTLPAEIMTGGRDTYSACQAEARRLRARGTDRLVAPSAALKPGGARGMVVDRGVHESHPRDGRVVVIYGPPAGLVGWVAAHAARPAHDLLNRVHHFPLS